MTRPLARARTGLCWIFCLAALGCARSPFSPPPRPIPPPAEAIPAPAAPELAIPSPPEKVGPAWFRIGGRVVYQEELDDWIRDELFEREFADNPATERWSYRAEAAERMIDRLVLEQEAKRRGVSTERVLQKEIDSLGPVTAAELLQFFEQNRERWPAEMPFEEAAPDIRAYIEGQRPRQARENLRRRLRVRFLSNPPAAHRPNSNDARQAGDMRDTPKP